MSIDRSQRKNENFKSLWLLLVRNVLGGTEADGAGLEPAALGAQREPVGAGLPAVCSGHLVLMSNEL